MLGIVARGDRRGLARLSEIVVDCMKPAKVLVVDMGVHRPFTNTEGIFPDRWGTVEYDDLLAGDYDWSPFLEGLTDVLCFEQPYDQRFFAKTAKAGVKSALMVMPEYHDRRIPQADEILLPTTWRIADYPRARVLEVPAVPFSPVPGDAVLHPGGSPAMLDRNGTRIVLEASTHCTFPILVRAQHDVAPPWHHAWVEVDDLEDPHDVFNGAALVVFPRRYGGLSLALADAMAAGLPVLTTDTPPYNAVLPHEALLVAKSTRRIHLVGGRIPVYDVDSRLLARRIEVTMGNPDLLEELRAASKKWTEAHSWDALRPAWEAVLGSVAA